MMEGTSCCLCMQCVLGYSNTTPTWTLEGGMDVARYENTVHYITNTSQARTMCLVGGNEHFCPDVECLILDW